MPDAYHFNPSIVNASHGDFPTRTVFGERMCVLYELEFSYDTSSQGGGVITLDQFVPITDGVLFFRRPGDIVNGIAPYSFACVVFDTQYDAAFDAYYRSDTLYGGLQYVPVENLRAACKDRAEERYSGIGCHIYIYCCI